MSITPAPNTAADGYRAITVAALMATYMQGLNISIPNAALPHIQGTLSMADDEVGWVFTSYIAASVVVMPMTGWLAASYGRKAIYQVSLAVFAVGLVLATLATTPIQFALARIVQGAASGPLVPLSTAFLLDVLPPARHARIGLAATVCVLLGISSGPSIGGWLSEYHGWHSIFYVSLPMTAFIFLAIALSLPEKRAVQKPAFDFFGLATFSLGIIGLQMLLDRGERLEWFASTEIRLEAIASLLGFYLFIVHVLTTNVHFLNKALFKDRNFVLSTIMFFALGVVLLPTLALTSPMLEELLNYPVDTTGYMTMPRGVTLVGALVLMSFVPARIDNRLFVIVGMALVVYANWLMLGYHLRWIGGRWPRRSCSRGRVSACCFRHLPRRHSERLIRNSTPKEPRSLACRASMEARWASRPSRSSSTTTPRRCTSRLQRTSRPTAPPRTSRAQWRSQASPCSTT